MLLARHGRARAAEALLYADEAVRLRPVFPQAYVLQVLAHEARRDAAAGMLTNADVC
jgi:hypothetical protein